MKKLGRIFLAFFGLLVLGEIADLAWLGYGHATITSNNNSITVSGTGSQTVFSFNFIGVQASDVTVVYTDANGNMTTLTQNTDYTITLNAPVAPNLWGIGGTVTYPLVGSPIAVGTTLTMTRAVPLQQTVSSNDGQSFPLAVEIGMDLLDLQIQQINSIFARALVQPITDTCSLTPMPSYIQRENGVLGFDSTGCNPIIVSTLPSGTVSSAMQPVINAASLAAGRTAFGLGSAATLNPNYGLQSNVSASGNLDADFATASDATNQTVSAAFHLTARFALGTITYTLPKSSTVWNGFGFWVTALDGPVTFAPNAADNFTGLASGASYIVPIGTSLYLTTNGAGTWYIVGAHTAAGMNMPPNLQINTSVGSNELTVAIKDSNGNDPSPTSPVIVAFRDPTLANGDPQYAAITAPLSITTAASGATLGTSNGVPFKLWVGLFNNAGSVVLGLYQSVTGGGSPTAVLPWDETSAQSPTALSGSSNAAATWYAGSAPTNVGLRVVGYIEFGTGQSTAGVWATEHSKTQLFGPGIHRPGDHFDLVYSTSTTDTTVSGSTKTQTHTGASITPSSPSNLVYVKAIGSALLGGANQPLSAQLSRGTGPTLIGEPANPAAITGTGGAGGSVPVPLEALDAPGTSVSTPYSVYIWLPTGSTTSQWIGSQNSLTTGSTITLEEIMSMAEPANDNGQPLSMVG